MKKVAALVVIIGIFCSGTAYAQSKEGNINFDKNPYIPIASFGLAQKITKDEGGLITQLGGYGTTLLNVGQRVRVLGLEGNLLWRSSYCECDDDTVERLGLGLLVPIINYRLTKDNNSGVLLVRLGYGYGFFAKKRPAKILLVGIAAGF